MPPARPPQPPAAPPGSPLAGALTMARQLAQAGRLREARVLAERALATAAASDPARAELLVLAATAALRSGDAPAAAAHFGQAATLRPGDGDLRNSLGVALQAAGRLAEAAAAFRQALTLLPDYAPAHFNLGRLLAQQGDYPAAIAALRQAPAPTAEIQSLLAELHQASGDDAAARAALGEVTRLRPQDPQGWRQLGQFLYARNEVPEALAAFDQLLAVAPQDAGATAMRLRLLVRIADWPALLAAEAALAADPVALDPFTLFLMPSTTPAQLLASARRIAEGLAGPLLARPPLQGRRPGPRPRLRIGYLSSDFHNHATWYLVAGVLERHDPAQVEVFYYSYGPHSDTPERRRLLAMGGLFRDLRELDDEAAARRILADDIDLLVDLKGYAAGHRPGITALRPAVLTINWLGFPGTLGHPRLADYLIGDAIVSPPHHAGHFSETLALLPHCYQPNDDRRAIGPTPTRAAVGLPESGLVLCSFNQTQKLRPETFEGWCRLLRELPGSVLWLLEPKHVAGRDNLRREAAARGVEAERLVFAPLLPQAEHLGRLRLADLALDTFPCGSHTTASDALWAGVPLLTRPGETFASRAAASIVTAAGLPELVFGNEADLLAAALVLGREPERLAALKAKVAAQRNHCALFDTAGFTRELERLYRRIWEQECRGERRLLAPGV